MNRIPVVNDEQRAGYGAPTTDVAGAAILTDGPLILPLPMTPIRLGVIAATKPAAKRQAVKKPIVKKPAAKRQATK